MKNQDFDKNIQENIQNFLRRHTDVLKILNSSSVDLAMFVGGCVRDILQGEQQPVDIDISTKILPDEVIAKFKTYKNSTINNKTTSDVIVLDKNKQYGTIIIILNGQRYEITTTRSDILCFGRKAKVEFCDSFQQDSERRDFTINALYLDANGNIHDFHNGIEDLKQNIVRFIGEPDKRIKEDYLRIIRFFRFSTKYNCKICDNKTKQAILQNKDGLLNLSRERIRNEIWKMMKYDNWFFGLRQLEAFDLLKSIFLLTTFITSTIEPHVNKHHSNVVNNSGKFLEITRMFYFFRYDLAVMETLSETLKFTREEKRFLEFLKKTWNTFSNDAFTLELKLILSSKNCEFYREIFWLLNAEKQKQILEFIQKIKPLPITPQDLIDLGFAGKIIGEQMAKLNKIWIKSNFSLSRDELIKLV